MRIIEGELRKDTWIYTASKLQFKIEKGTRIKCENREVITFDGKDGIVLFKLNGVYLVSAFGEVHRILFPKGGDAPYPLSLLF